LSDALIEFRLSDLLDLASIQKMAEAHYRAAGMPIGIIDAVDGSILMGSGWQDICVKFHRSHPETLRRCRDSDDFIKSRLAKGEACSYKCKNGLWDIGMPIIVSGRHLATLFLGQFFYEDEVPDRAFFIDQARRYGFDEDDYLHALDHVPVFSREKVDYILEYNKALVGFICDLAEHALQKKYQADFFQRLIDAMPYPVFYKDRQGRYLSCNRAFEMFFGVHRDRIAGKMVHAVAPRQRADMHMRIDKELFHHPGARTYDAVVQSADGADHDVIFHKATFQGDDGALAGLVGSMLDITERRRVERALEESEAKIRSIMDNVGVGVALISPQMEVLEMNPRMRQWFPDVALQDKPFCFNVFNDPPRGEVCDYCPTSKTLQDGKVHESTTQTRQGGAVRNYRLIASPICNAAGEVLAATELVEDITEKLSLESQLRQAQKMEAVGRLAGGVAHDFNNMLSVILGYAELALYKLDATHPVHTQLEQIRGAARRSADIIRQLLAFARKQTIAPQLLDLNETVEGILKILRRMIGEDIDLVWHSDSGLWPVHMDPTQIEQILANLCVNARDAIQGIGQVTIETANVHLDESYCEEHAGFQPGAYVMLAVSDDGCGMDADALDKIFEPFFTTKAVGRGTGLGLATVYGIVKQNDGFISVDSQKEQGTTFRIYFPRHHGPVSDLPREDNDTLLPGQGETVLVVEDEEAVLELTHSMLVGLGYTVKSAGSPEEALRLAREYDGEIDLLITDVIMPGMNGKTVAEKIGQARPTMKLLFMSGYTADVIAHRSMLDPGVEFISKPFTIQQLSVKVRQVLGKKE
jgi:two-component system, cell cycle sensor histidine kinase and response regulator CckA